MYSLWCALPLGWQVESVWVLQDDLLHLGSYQLQLCADNYPHGLNLACFQQMRALRVAGHVGEWWGEVEVGERVIGRSLQGVIVWCFLQVMAFVASTAGNIWTKFGLAASVLGRVRQEIYHHMVLMDLQQQIFCQTGITHSRNYREFRTPKT